MLCSVTVEAVVFDSAGYGDGIGIDLAAIVEGVVLCFPP